MYRNKEGTETEMARQFTAQEIEDAKWAVELGIETRQHARMLERLRNLSEQDVLDRIPAENKERFIRGKSLYAEGAYRP